MKFFYCSLTMFLWSHLLVAQNKACKFINTKTGDGQPISMVQASSKLGNFLIGKKDGKYLVAYNTKAFFGQMSMLDVKNVAFLKIDSVTLLFDGLPAVTLRAASGTGKLPNESGQLQPQMFDVTFSLMLSPDDKTIPLFLQHKLKVFRVFGQKDAKYGDQLNDKQQDKLMQSFACIQ